MIRILGAYATLQNEWSTVQKKNPPAYGWQGFITAILIEGGGRS